MYIRSLKLGNFKNYESQSLDFSERLNCLTGLNGMGKTNVLDAIYFLCLCRSQSGLSDRNLVRQGESFFRLEGQFAMPDEKVKVVAKFQIGQSKEFERNNQSIERLSDHVGRFPVVMIAPDDVTLVQEGSEDRRRFLDATLSQIYVEYLQNLLIYNALLKQRNALLKSFYEQRSFDPELLESIDRQMPEPAKAIFEYRNLFVKRFTPHFKEFYAAISGNREQVEVLYRSELEENSQEELLHLNREKDRVLQRTSSGIHRDDLLLMMDGMAVKKFASQGQLKSYLLALRLAQYEMLRQEKNILPILLLDDIFDKLDAQRVRKLVALLLEKQFGQIFITDTQRERLESIVGSFEGDYRFFEVQEGKIA